MDLLCLNCQQKFPNRAVINGETKNLQRRKYCLVCSPWGKHNTLKIHLPPTSTPNKRRCSRCSKSLPLKEFYSKRGKPHASAYCKFCTSLQVTERTQRFKELIVEYNKCIAALEFHHRDSTKKEFGLSQLKCHSHNLSPKVKKELDKCDLLCANCHREVHHQSPRLDSDQRPAA